MNQCMNKGMSKWKKEQMKYIGNRLSLGTCDTCSKCCSVHKDKGVVIKKSNADYFNPQSGFFGWYGCLTSMSAVHALLQGFARIVLQRGPLCKRLTTIGVQDSRADLCSNLKRDPLGTNCVTMLRFGGCVQAPMNKTTFGCFRRFIMLTSALNSCTQIMHGCNRCPRAIKRELF